MERMLDQGRFRVGAVLSQSFSIFFGNFVSFVVLAIAVHLPAALLIHYINLRGTSPLGAMAGGFAIVVLRFVPSYVVAGIIIYGVFRYLQEQPFTIADCVRASIGRLGMLILVSLVAGLLIALGLLALIFPGLILLVMFAVVTPVVVVERKGVSGALGRSSSLTKGRRWSVFGVLVVLVILMIIASLISLAVAAAVPGALGAIVVSTLISGIASAFHSVVTVIMYYRLRVDKEGIGIQHIAEVFA